MNAAMIGTLVGISVILFITMLRGFEKWTLYALTLTGIGFLYVGYTWSDPLSLGVNAVQAVFFVFLSYYGIRKDITFLTVGYFLHGLWDLAYDYLQLPALRPPHYDLFCFMIDFIIGVYLAILQWKTLKRQKTLGSKVPNS